MALGRSSLNMRKVAIVEYGIGNLDSVARATEESGGKPVLASQPADLRSASHIILPGVGAFAVGMRNLFERGFIGELAQRVTENVPLLGICLGMQLLATKGWEGGTETNGLGWIPGEVKRLQAIKPEERIPHVGWNEVVFEHSSPLFQGVPQGKNFYFVHSYHFDCAHQEDIQARTAYCGGFVSAVAKHNVFGVQFHPEKSQRFGLQVIRNFLAL